jgi:subtilisin family serine protease
MKKLIAYILFTCTLLALNSCKTSRNAPEASALRQSGGKDSRWRGFLVRGPAIKQRFAADEILVQFKPTATAKDRQRVFRLMGGTHVEPVWSHPVSIAAHRPATLSIGSSDVVLIKFSSQVTLLGNTRARFVRSALWQTPQRKGPEGTSAGTSVDEVVANIGRDPAVYHAQPNFKYHITDYPANDSLYQKGATWGMASAGTPSQIGPVSNQYATEAEELWKANEVGSNKVIIAIIDTGAQMDHPDLAANIDKTDAKDFFRGQNDVNYNKDENGHGTHVAGIIGAVGGNGIGIAGVAWHVTLIPVKFIGPDGTGDTADAIQAFNYLIGLKHKGMNIVAINASWSNSREDPLLLRAIKDAGREGIITVAAASNEGVDIGQNEMYPASIDTSADNSDESGTLQFNSVITVAAIDSNGQLASFSNFGGSVELGAPGVGIVSTMIPNPNPGLVPDTSALITEANGATYASLDGTSMAAPFVTGAVALLASAHLDSTGHTSISAKDICDLIRKDALGTPTVSLTTKTSTNGRLDIAKLLP